MGNPEEGWAFLCGYKPKKRLRVEDLTKAERKALNNFREFLIGKGKRCPHCLHKRKRHHDRLPGPLHGCLVGDCPCALDRHRVDEYRKKVKAL